MQFEVKEMIVQFGQFADWEDAIMGKLSKAGFVAGRVSMKARCARRLF